MSIPNWITNVTSNLLKRPKSLKKQARKKPAVIFDQMLEVLQEHLAAQMNADQVIFGNFSWKCQSRLELYLRDQKAASDIQKAELFKINKFEAVFT